MALACLAACGSDAPQHCERSDLKHYDEAVSRVLGAKGVSHSLGPDKGVCVSASDASALVQAAREVDRYFHEVADLVRDACDERALVEWATRERLRFEIRDTTSGHRMFLLRSFGMDEAAANLRRLRLEAPRGACPGG